MLVTRCGRWGGDALHPNRCQLWAARQFRDRENWNAAASPLQRVPALRRHRSRRVAPVWSLSLPQRLLPTSLL